MTREENVFVGAFLSGFFMALLLVVLKRYLWRRSLIVGDDPIEFSPTNEYILSLVVRSDIPLVKSKLAIHCSHASVMAFDALLEKDPQAARFWQSTGQTKMVLAVDSIHDINRLDDLARELGIISTFVCDTRVSLVGPSPVTVLGIGPGPQNVVSQITHHLGLL